VELALEVFIELIRFKIKDTSISVFLLFSFAPHVKPHIYMSQLKLFEFVSRQTYVFCWLFKWTL